VKALPAPTSKEGARRVSIQDVARRRRADKHARFRAGIRSGPRTEGARGTDRPKRTPANSNVHPFEAKQRELRGPVGGSHVVRCCARRHRRKNRGMWPSPGVRIGLAQSGPKANQEVVRESWYQPEDATPGESRESWPPVSPGLMDDEGPEVGRRRNAEGRSTR